MAISNWPISASRRFCQNNWTEIKDSKTRPEKYVGHRNIWRPSCSRTEATAWLQNTGPLAASSMRCSWALPHSSHHRNSQRPLTAPMINHIPHSCRKTGFCSCKSCTNSQCWTIASWVRKRETSASGFCRRTRRCAWAPTTSMIFSTIPGSPMWTGTPYKIGNSSRHTGRS